MHEYDCTKTELQCVDIFSYLLSPLVRFPFLLFSLFLFVFDTGTNLKKGKHLTILACYCCLAIIIATILDVADMLESLQ